MRDKKMQITKLDYPVCGKKKYRVIYNNKEYTCYLVPFGDNLVVTGDGNAENFKDITMTKLGTRIMIACHKAD